MDLDKAQEELQESKYYPNVPQKTKDKSRGGEIPSSINPPSGCAFHPCCSLAEQACSQQLPDLVEVIRDHFVRCHAVNNTSFADNNQG